MQIIRSILGVVVGGAVAIFLVMVAETTNFLVYKPAEAPGLDEFGKLWAYMQSFKEDPERVCAFVKTVPMSAMVVVLLAWEVAAFVGGWTSARIAGRWPLLHAGLIGTLILVGTAMSFNDMKKQGVPQPDWMIILGLLLPLPMSLLGGKLVAVPPAPAAAPGEMPDGAVKAGEPPVRPA